MNLMTRMSRLIVAATFMAGSPGSVYAAGAIAPVLANNAGARTVSGRGMKNDSAAQARARAAYAGLPLYFEANRGQTDASVKFFSRAAGYNLYLTPSEAVMVMSRAKGAKNKGGVALRMKLKGANANPTISGQDILPGRTSYFLGSDRSKWLSGVEQYAKVKLSRVYPGIDMVYYGKQGQIEHDFIVAPGANPGRILMGFEGGKSLRLDPRGNLIVGVEGGEVTYNAPTLYQMAGAKRTHVNGRFVLVGTKNVRIEVGDYIRSKELVIDPALGYSSFLGGTTVDNGNAIVIDSLGQAYVTGTTNSVAFPNVAAHYQPANGGGLDVFVTQINAAGSANVWSTYIGGAGDDIGNGIALDGASPPNVYVTGSTTDRVTFPNTKAFGILGGTDAFVASLNNAGTVLKYSTVFGGPQVESGNGIAVDSAGNAYVTGVTGSMAANSFPYTFAGGVAFTAGADQTTGGGATDAFVAKFSVTGSQVYATYLGGTGTDAGSAIAIDAIGNAYVTGQCGDGFVSVAGYPTVFKNTVTGASDAFIAILNPSGSSFVYKTYVGGSGIDQGTGIKVDASGNIYITGVTYSADFPGAGFVTVGQTTIGTAPDAFVFKLHPFNPGGGTNDGVYATYLGASGYDQANGIAIDAAGNAYVVGYTASGDFPMVGPIAGGGTLVGNPEAFVTQLGPTGATIGFSTYLGGTTMSYGQGIALDSANNIYVTGYTNSSAATFPLLTPFQAANAGSFDAFVTKFGSAGPPPVACTITSVSPAQGFTIGGTTVTITGTGFSSLLAPGVTFGAVAASTYTLGGTTSITAVTPANAASSVILTVKAAGGSCTSAFNYVVAPVGGGPGPVACGTDYFFPSPNPGPIGTFAYCMDHPGTARFRVYNAIGDLVARVVDSKPAGASLSTLNTARLAPGVYMYVTEKEYGGGVTVHLPVKKFVVKH
jgi:hypothetical protein